MMVALLLSLLVAPPSKTMLVDGKAVAAKLEAGVKGAKVLTTTRKLTGFYTGAMVSGIGGIDRPGTTATFGDVVLSPKVDVGAVTITTPGKVTPAVSAWAGKGKEKGKGKGNGKGATARSVTVTLEVEGTVARRLAYTGCVPTALTATKAAHQLTVKCSGLTATEPDGKGGADPLLTRLNEIVAGGTPVLTVTQIASEAKKAQAQRWQIQSETMARVILKN